MFSLMKIIKLKWSDFMFSEPTLEYMKIYLKIKCFSDKNQTTNKSGMCNYQLPNSFYKK